MNVLAQCEKCRERFKINGSNIVRKQCDYNGKMVWVTHYDCPKCKNRHYVQIDDVRSNALLKQNSRQLARISIMVQKGESGKEATRAKSKFNKTKKQLSKTRKQLMKDLNNRIVLDVETNEMFVLKFSI